MKNYIRYDLQITESIEAGLKECKNASELANLLGIDVSGLIKHIKAYRVLAITVGFNKCGRKMNCHRTNLCPTCIYSRYRKDPKECAYCHKNNCNQTCPDYTLEPQCERIKKFPYVCDGCPKIIHCHLNHYHYDGKDVYKKMATKRSVSRKGCQADQSEFERLSKLLKPLILDKHQSLSQIFLTHKEKIRYSYPTILKYIDLKLIPGITNGDLTKRVRYPAKYKKHKDEPTNFAVKTNRTYDDFIEFISNNPLLEVVEMDTVVSCRGSDACLLTLLFRKSNFMLAFKLEDKNAAGVHKVFEYIQGKLGYDLYEATFKCVLTDNGSEFANPISIEFCEGVKVSNLYYCDPGKSGQKGKIEKNHEELRKIFPKGTDFYNFSQKDINYALCHVNSEPRAILNRNAPGTIARVFLDEKVLALNEYNFLVPDDVTLHPSVFKK